jgi:RNA polymerase sigma-70 factor (ECF subfamily)
MSLECEQSPTVQLSHEAASFAQLYDRYFPRLYAYMRYRVPCPQDAEDLVAETFLQVVKHIGVFEWRHDGAFAAWLFRIAHNLVSNFYRQRRREALLPLDAASHLHAHTPPPEEIVLQQEQVAQLYQLLGTLSPRQQEVLTLKFFAGLPNHEIAAVLSLNTHTVAAYLCRGIEALHQKYIGAVGLEEWGARMCIREQLGRQPAPDSMGRFPAISATALQDDDSLADFCADLAQLAPKANATFRDELWNRLQPGQSMATAMLDIYQRMAGWLNGWQRIFRSVGR